MKPYVRLVSLVVSLFLLILPTCATLADSEPVGLTKAVDIALAAAGVSEAEITGFEKLEADLNDARPHYEVEFRIGAIKYEVEVDAFSGAVLKTETEKDRSPFEKFAIIPMKTAFEALLTEKGIDAASVDLVKADLDDDPAPHYDFEFRTADAICFASCSAVSGAVNTFDSTPILAGNSGPVDAEQAKAIALERAGYTEQQVRKLEVEYDKDNAPHFEVSFKADGFEFECDIDIATGAILSFEKERD